MVEETYDLSCLQEAFTQPPSNYDYIWDELAKSDVQLFLTEDDWGIGRTPMNEVNVENLASGSGMQILNNEFETDLVPLENPHAVDEINLPSPVASDNQYIPSSLPASQTWLGDYEFTVSFDPQPKTTKGVAWTYSKMKDKLYVGKDCPCPVNFSVNTIMPSDVSVRAMALYTCPGQASEVVRRCIDHSMEEMRNGIREAEHLIRCESSGASYYVDSITGRHSVIVPFENPPAGQHYSTYIYKFTCYGSCSGGPNRRPLMVIFTLERGNQVIGRRKLDVKICACPGRDKKTEESQCNGLLNTHSAAGNTETVESMNMPSKKLKVTTSRDELYEIKLESKECAEFLHQAKNFYELSKSVESLSPDVLKTMLYYQKKKNNEDSD